MYSKQEAGSIRRNFWTSFGQYMKPVTGASGEAVNWINYKTGIRHIYFRMDADNRQASIAIELWQPDPAIRLQQFHQLQQVKAILENSTGEPWQWQEEVLDEHGKIFSRVGTRVENVNLFKSEDWPTIISFLKPRMIALDGFWELVKDHFA